MEEGKGNQPFLSFNDFLRLESWSAQHAKYTSMGGKVVNPNKDTVTAYLTEPPLTRRK
jgi:monoamine oxidase